MKIRRITATPINFPLEAPYGWVFGELPGFSRTIVEVETDDRLVGLGEASGGRCAGVLPPPLSGARPDEQIPRPGPARHLPAFAAELMGAPI